MEKLAASLIKIPGLKQWAYYTARFPKLGLMFHDVLRMDDPVTKEAASRLPKDLAAERQFRISRALYLDARQQILPKEEWMTPEKETLYMNPYLEQVKKEFQEKRDYERKMLTYRSGAAPS